MKKIFYLFLFILTYVLTPEIQAQEYYWVAFSDKNNTTYSLSHPEDYLSERAIQRRIRQNIAIDSLDLPVNQEYISQVLRPGVTLVHSSKWLNGITVKVEIDSFENKISCLPFVKEVQLTKSKPKTLDKSASSKWNQPNAWSDNEVIDTSYYGPSVYQTGLLNGQVLHRFNFWGEGMQIAVLDAGFFHVNVYAAFDSLWANNQILGTKDFVEPDTSIFETDPHGMSVLSCLAGNIPNALIGTAPKASYWLIRTEDKASEYLIEEDNWVAGAEYADSIGADIINSSLGYYLFDDSTMNHTYADMDGKTTRVTQGANIAFSKGMLVLASAGNEGNQVWRHILAPSDGDNVISVGAVNKFGFPPDFTSVGPAYDGDVKPNVAAVGWNTYLEMSNGNLGSGSGTSFASPVMAGMAACLWEAVPNVCPGEIKLALEQSSHLYDQPDSVMGYGVPDMKIALQILGFLSADKTECKNNWSVYPNPFSNSVIVKTTGTPVSGKVQLSLFSADGRLLMKKIAAATSPIILNNLQSLPAGLLILRIDTENSSESIKLNKSR